MRNLKCKNCGASNAINVINRDFAFCQYCGSKIMFDDYRSTQRIVNEAKVVQAETDKLVQLKKLEMEEKRRIVEQKNQKTALVLFALGILTFVIEIKVTSPELLLVGMFLFLAAMMLAFKNDKNDSNNQK